MQFLDSFIRYSIITLLQDWIIIVYILLIHFFHSIGIRQNIKIEINCTEL